MLREAKIYVPLRDRAGKATEIYRKALTDRLIGAFGPVYVTDSEQWSVDSNGRTVHEAFKLFTVIDNGAPGIQEIAADVAKALDLDVIVYRYGDGEVVRMSREQWEALTF
jgi:hypothetical protein